LRQALRLGLWERPEKSNLALSPWTQQQEQPVRLLFAQVFLQWCRALLATFLQRAEQDLARSAELTVQERSLMLALAQVGGQPLGILGLSWFPW
jgi:hypothetical protein